MKGSILTMNDINMIKPTYEAPHQMGEKTPKFVILLVFSAFPLFGVALMALGIFGLYWEVRNGRIYEGIETFFLAFGTGFFLLILGWKIIMWGGASYRFETDGLHVKYPFHSWHIIPWDSFQQVCVLYSMIKREHAHTDICCIMKGEKTNMFGRWKTDNPFKYRTVISISYTPELHEGIKERCPYEIFDLRGTPNYRLK